MNTNYRANFSPSVSSPYVRSRAKGFETIRSSGLPRGLSDADLDIFAMPDRSKCCNPVLLSYGQYNTRAKERHIPPRTECSALILGDSGGYQLIEDPSFYQGESTILASLKWQEKHCDIAVTFDFPTRAITRPGHFLTSIEQCRELYLEALKLTRKQRKSADLKLLTVIQGNNKKQALDWLKAVGEFQFEGWAFGGAMKLDPELLLECLVQMRDRKLLDATQWIHVLGTGTILASLLLSTIGGTIGKVMGRQVPVSFDSSSPFRMSYERLRGYGYASLRPEKISSPMHLLPRNRTYCGSTAAFPYPTSNVGRRISCGDLCIHDEIHRDHAWDEVSHALVAIHNLETLRNAHDQAHRLYQLEPLEARQHLPSWLIALKDICQEVMSSERPMSQLRQHKSVFDRARVQLRISEEEEHAATS